VHQASAAPRFAGVHATGAVTDWRALIAQKDELVASLRRSKYSDLLRTYDSITYMEGKARIAEGGVAIDGNVTPAGRVVITTGAPSTVPQIPGIEHVDYLTSTSALALETLPRSLLVVGGGFVGAELAQALARAGVHVTIVCRSRLLPEAEPEISDA